MNTKNEAVLLLNDFDIFNLKNEKIVINIACAQDLNRTHLINMHTVLCIEYILTIKSPGE